MFFYDFIKLNLKFKKWQIFCQIANQIILRNRFRNFINCKLKNSIKLYLLNKFLYYNVIRHIKVSSAKSTCWYKKVVY